MRERERERESVCVQMQGQRLRVQAVAAVLQMACREGDAVMAMEYMCQWDSCQPLPDCLVAQLLGLARLCHRDDLREEVFSLLRSIHQDIGREAVAELQTWAQRSVVDTLNCSRHTTAASLSLSLSFSFFLFLSLSVSLPLPFSLQRAPAHVM